MNEKGDRLTRLFHWCEEYRGLQRVHAVAVRQGQELLGHTKVHVADPVEIWNSYTIPRQRTQAETKLAEVLWEHRIACEPCRRYFGYNK